MGRLNEKGEVYCPTCKTHKPKTEYHKMRRHKLGLGYQCKSCAASRSKDAHYKTRYGMLEEDKLTLIREQDNKCACCGGEFDDTFKGRPVIDHCHTTGVVRTILCDRCNIALGNVGEDIELCQSLIKYIRRHC